MIDGALLAAAHHRPGLLGRTLSHAEDFYDRAYAPLTVVGLCLLGAMFFALSSVMEQREAAAAPPGTTMRVGLLVHLLRRPLWMLGNLAGIVGFAFQFLALRRGSLALVQPLLVTGLVFALAGSAMLDHRRLTRREWASTSLVAAGLALFLIVALPGRGNPNATSGGWIALAVTTTGVVAALWILGRRDRRRRPLYLGAGAGVLFGATAALIERTGHLAGAGLWSVLGHWPPYALAVVGLAGLLMTQSAFQAGELKWSLPVLTVVEPLVAILIGQTLFAEHIALNGLAPVGEAIGLAMMVAGVFGLTKGMEHHPTAAVEAGMSTA